MFNTQLQKQLDNAVKSKKIQVKYPRGYQRWKKRFDSALVETQGDVLKALEKVHEGNYATNEH